MFLTPAGTIRFDGETADGQCDRTWALALRQHAARMYQEIGFMLG